MALNFPDSPTLNQIYTDATSGFSYQWNGTVWISYSASTTSNISQLDNISSSFNGVTTSFSLTVNGIAVSPATDAQLIISVGGVMQDPTQDYYISGTNIVFTTAPVSGLTFFGTVLGSAFPLNTISDNSVSPTKLTTGGPTWNSSGDFYVSGISTLGIVTATQLTNTLLVNYSEKINALGNTGSSKNINIEDGNYITATLNQSTTFTFTSPASGKVYGFSLFLTNGSGGPFTITWPISIKWPNNTTPVRTTADGKSDIWVFSTIDGGTTWYGYIGIYDFS